jgi:hypothetical protein
MRYITRATLVARLRSNAWATIFIPPGEVIEADKDPENQSTVQLLWRGQNLRVAEPDLATSTEIAEPSLKS